MDQNTANELVTGAPGMITLGGRVLFVSRPADRDHVLMREFLRKRIKTPLQAIADKVAALPREFQQAAIREAVTLEAGGSAITPEAAMDVLLTPEGCRFLAWLAVRKNHPDVTLEQLAAWITEENVLQVFADLDETAGRGLGKGAGQPS